MKIPEILASIGLNAQQAAIYVSLVEHGPMTVAAIARTSNLHRPAVYAALPTLEKTGLISVVPKGKQKTYAAQSPEQLRQLAQNVNTKLEQVLPDLERAYATQGTRPIVKFFEGKEGITAVLSDLVHTLKKGDTYYRYTSNEDIDSMDKYLPHGYREMRDRKELERYIINNEKSAKLKQLKLGRSIKPVPHVEDPFNYGISQLIYGDKVAFLDFNTETAVIIENKKIADLQRATFKLLYKKL